MKVSIVIPVFNQLTHTRNCLNDLLKTAHPIHEIVVVDDGSDKEPISKAISKLFPQVILLKNETNQGFARTVNKGIRAATGDYILLLNNDVRLKNTRWLNIMLENMERRGLDMVAPAGARMDESKWEYLPGEAKKETDKFSYLPFWCFLTKRAVFDNVGPIPEYFFPGFWEDCLWGIKARRIGLKAGIVENTEVQHAYHSTFKAEGYNLAKEYEEKRKIFLKKIKEI